MESTIPLTGAARMTPVQPDIQLPGDPLPGLPRPRDPSENPAPFTAEGMWRGTGFAA